MKEYIQGFHSMWPTQSLSHSNQQWNTWGQKKPLILLFKQLCITTQKYFVAEFCIFFNFQDKGTFNAVLIQVTLGHIQTINIVHL